MNYLELAKKDGGFTLDGQGKPVKFSEGYLVSKPGWETRLLLEGLEESVVSQAWIPSYRSWCEGRPSWFIGAWIDETLLYLDITQHFEDLDYSLALGKARNQKAIFDCSAGKSIYLEADKR